MTVATTSRLRYSHCIGFFSEMGRGFSNPYDLAPAEGGLLYVINRSNGADAPNGGMRIATCTLDSDYLGEFGDYGEGEGQLVWPTAIALDSQGSLWISDEHRNDVQAFSPEGRFLRRVGGPGSGPGQLQRPAGLAIDGEDNLIVADALNNRVQKLSPSGQPLALWGEPGSGPGQLDLPWGVAIDRQGQVYVADWRNDRVQKLSPDGRYLATFGTDGPDASRLRRPSAVAVDDEGSVYVADWGHNQVKVFAPGGELVARLVGDADLSKWAQEYLAADTALAAERQVAADPEQERRFWGPTGLKLDHQGRLYVVESCRHRIQIYQRV